MTRVLDALRNLQQPAPAETVASISATTAPLKGARSEKQTPRLAASVRQAVLGTEVGRAAQTDSNAAAIPVLLCIPEIHKGESPLSAQPVASSSSVLGQRPPATAIPKQPDPVSLVDAIAASLREVAREESVASHPTSTGPVALAASPLRASANATSSKRQPTRGESEVYATLSNERTAEAYRALLTAVARDTQNFASPVVTLIGLDDSDSTAFVATCLASLASEYNGQQVLLVEGHGTNHALSRLYDAYNATGLSDSPPSEIRSRIVATAQEKLSALPFGHAASASLQSVGQGLGNVIGGLRDDYGLVVIDGGPIEGSLSIAASRCSVATYLMVRLGDALAEPTVALVNRFRAAGGKISGCIAIEPSSNRSSPLR